MKLPDSQNGFTPIEFLVIAIIVGIGFYFGLQVLNNNLSTVPKTNTPVSTAQVNNNSSQSEETSQNQTKENSTLTPTPQTISDAESKQILLDLVAGGLNCDLKDQNGKIVQNQCRVDKVVGNYAKGQRPMAYWIAQKINNKWKVVVSGNGIPKCEEIDQYSIPKDIFENCIEASGVLRY